MKIKEIDWLLTSKLDFVRARSASGSHLKYRLVGDKGEIAVPTFLVIPQHAGDISRSVLKTSAAALGMNCTRLEKSGNCHISAHCIYLCLGAMAVGLGMTKFFEDPVTNQHLPARVDGTLVAILALAASNKPEWSRDAVSAVKAAEDTYLADPRTTQNLQSLTRWYQLVKAGCEETK